MPRRSTLTPEEREQNRKQRAKEWYIARRDQLLEKQKAYEKEKRQREREAGLRILPHANLKAMTEEQRKEHRRRQHHESYLKWKMEKQEGIRFVKGEKVQVANIPVWNA